MNRLVKPLGQPERLTPRAAEPKQRIPETESCSYPFHVPQSADGGLDNSGGAADYTSARCYDSSNTLQLRS